MVDMKKMAPLADEIVIVEMSESGGVYKEDDNACCIYDLVNEVFPGKYRKKIVFDDTFYKKYIAVEGDCVVGFCFWKENGSRRVLHVIGVKPGYRRKKIGAKMMERSIFDFKSETSCSGIDGHCRVNNPAREFHKYMGFKETGIDGQYYNNGDDAVVIRMDL